MSKLTLVEFLKNSNHQAIQDYIEYSEAYDEGQI